MNSDCSTHGWSVIASAAADSQVASVFAGFVFTCIILLLGRPGQKNTQALSLFCATFLVLGFDSHIYGVLSGHTSDTLCGRVWSEEMVAAGMLSVGGIALITGISWLLYSQFDTVIELDSKSNNDQPAPAINLDRCVQLMVHGACAAVALLLADEAHDYLAIIFRMHPARLLAWAVLAFPALLAGIYAMLSVYASRRPNRHRGVKANTANAYVRRATYGILAYSVAGPVLSGVTSEIAANWWQPPSQVMIAAVLLIGLTLPGFLLLLLLQAVPPLSERNADQWHLSRVEERASLRLGDRQAVERATGADTGNLSAATGPDGA